MKQSALKRRTSLLTRTSLKRNKPMSTKRSKRAKARDFPLDVRMTVWERGNGICELCGSAIMVDPHHATFKSSLGKGELKNCLGLCRTCHDLAHEKREVREKCVELAKILAKGGSEHGCPHVNAAYDSTR